MKCNQCNEIRSLAIRKGIGICHNCSKHNKDKKVIAFCPICQQHNIPSEYHHIAGRAVNEWYGVQICCNCHFILSNRQNKYWRKEASNTIKLIQGLYDYSHLMMRNKSWHKSQVVVKTYLEAFRHFFIAWCELQGFVLWK